MSRIMRNCNCVVALLLLASGACFASPAPLNLNIVGTSGPTAGDLLQGFGGFETLAGNFAVAFEPGPVVSSGVINEYTGETSYSYGPGGSVDIYAIGQQGIPILEYTGTFLSGSSDMTPLPPTDIDFAFFSGTFVLNGYSGEGTLSTSHSFKPEIDNSTLNFSGAPTPEPNSLLLMLSGLGILTAIARRRIWV